MFVYNITDHSFSCNLSEIHSAHLDLFLITLFAMVVFSTIQEISPKFHFYNAGSMCLKTYFKHFIFIKLSDLNSNLNKLFESSSISVNFSVNF